MKRSKSTDTIKVLLQLLEIHKESLEGSAIRSLITSLTLILSSLETTKCVWSDENVVKALTLLFDYCVHESGKIRHHAQDEISKLFEMHYEVHFAETTELVVSYLSKLNASFTKDNPKAISYFLALIRRICQYLDSAVDESLLKLLLQVIFDSIVKSRSVNIRLIIWIQTVLSPLS